LKGAANFGTWILRIEALLDLKARPSQIEQW
jgi:hypothetical protein